MKKLHLFLLVSLVSLVVSVIATTLVWYFLVLAPIDKKSEIKEIVTQSDSTDSDTVTVPVDSSGQTTVAPAVTDRKSIFVSIVDLPPSQQTIIRTLGIEGDSFEVTPAAQVCAEAKLGASRLDQIVAGDTPSILEATTLYRCL